MSGRQRLARLIARRVRTRVQDGGCPVTATADTGSAAGDVEARDLLRLGVIQASLARASGQPVPGLPPADLGQAIYEAFVTSNGVSHVDRLCDEWLELAGEHGIAVDDERGDLLPGVDDAITRTVTAAIWFGLTTGYLALGGRYRIPGEFLP